jgi:hypothetical protein
MARRSASARSTLIHPIHEVAALRRKVRLFLW